MATQNVFPSIVVAAVAAGINKGVLWALNNKQWARLISIHALYVADAGVFNRQPVIDVRDGQGNVIWSTTSGSFITASQTIHLNAGGSTQQTVSAFNRQTAPLCAPLLIPPGSVIIVYDSANNVTSDTIAGDVVIVDDAAMY